MGNWASPGCQALHVPFQAFGIQISGIYKMSKKKKIREIVCSPRVGVLMTGQESEIKPELLFFYTLHTEFLAILKTPICH